MSLLTSVIDHPYAGLLAWSLVHFLWQGAVLALLMGVWLRWLKPSATSRYIAGVLTLAAMLAAPVATFSYLASTSGPAPASLAIVATDPVSGVVPPLAPGPSQKAGSPAPVERLGDFGLSSRGLVLAVWLAGVVTLSLRLLGGWILARRLTRRAIRPVTPEIHALARRVAGRLALDRIVDIVESSAVMVPVMVGWLKPVVLLPAAALSGLTPSQIEALLAHELAHIRRHDYLVNLLQSVVETLLFYHPAVWWVSRRVRAEREHCCDDLAVAVCDRLIYVSALTDLAAMTTRRGMALAATDGSLLRRVRRLLGQRADDHEGTPGWVPVLLIALVAAIVPVAMASAGLGGQSSVGGTTRWGSFPQGPGNDVLVGNSPIIGSRRLSSDPLDPGVSGGAEQAPVVGAVVAGVPGGVVGGVPGGVIGGAVAAIPGQDARQREETAAARLLEVQKKLEALQDERMALEQRQAETEMNAQIKVLETQLAAMRRQHADAKKKVDTGLVGGDVLAELESRINALQLEIEGARTQQQHRAAEADLRRREMMYTREHERLQAELEQARGAMMEEMDTRARLEQSRLQEEQKRLDSVMQAEAMRSLEVGSDLERLARTNLLLNSIEITGPNETIRIADILTIEIKDEPDLPRAYVVQTDGTVRLPLLGAIKVQGFTTRQAAQAITKQLTDRRLGARGVEVGLRRQREP